MYHFFLADIINRDDEGWHREGDEIINDSVERLVQKAKVSTMPSKLKATIKFGYEDSMKEWLDSNGQDFDSWITGPLTHAQAIYRHESDCNHFLEANYLFIFLFRTI